MALNAETSLIAGRLYEGILDPAQWYAGLEAIRLMTDGALFYHFAVDMRTFEVVSSLQNAQFPEDVIRDYELNHAKTDERMPVVMGMSVGQIMFDHEHFDRRQLSRSFIYNDWLPTLGYRHTMCAPVYDDGITREFFSIIRPSDYVAYGTESRTLMTRLMPDLMRATKLRAQTARLSRLAALGLSALDSLLQGMVLVDAQCRIQYTNTAADYILSAAYPLLARHGQIACADASGQALLRTLVASACSKRVKAGAFQLKGTDKRIAVTVLPLRPDSGLAVHCLAPLALLVLSSPDAIAAIDHAVVGEMLGLSPTETRLALLLATGKTVKDFAAIEGCSWHTARTHAKNLLRKTGCHRQIELAQLLQSMQLC